MVLAEVEDGAGQQEEGGARGRGEVAYSWLCYRPPPPGEASCCSPWPVRSRGPRIPPLSSLCPLEALGPCHHPSAASGWSMN